jgi:hypothetical protein
MQPIAKSQSERDYRLSRDAAVAVACTLPTITIVSCAQRTGRISTRETMIRLSRTIILEGCEHILTTIRTGDSSSTIRNKLFGFRSRNRVVKKLVPGDFSDLTLSRRALYRVLSDA